LIIGIFFAVFGTILHYYPQADIQAVETLAKTETQGINTPKDNKNATQPILEPSNQAQVVEKPEPSVSVPVGDMFDKYFGNQANVMRAVCQAESGLNPLAISKPNKNSSIDYGICQINSIHLAKVGGDYTKLLDLETNLSVAKQILDDSGLNAWTTYKSGKYKQFLK
jgi:hypothetical protein